MAEIVGCACGEDHEVVPSEDGVELVCRTHKRHIPCRRCRRERLDELARVIADG